VERRRVTHPASAPDRASMFCCIHEM
jgi:hypothetical protein